MVAVLNMARQLLSLGRSQLESFRAVDGARTLRRLLDLPNLAPEIAAEANFLVAQIHFDRSEFAQACDTLSAALKRDPDNADCHFLFAQANDRADDHDDSESLEHYACAAKLAPDDGRKVSAYARKLAETSGADSGLPMLEKAYSEHGDDPVVVENFVEALVEANEFDDAALLVAQASHRNADDGRFKQVRRRFEQRLRHTRLFEPHRISESKGESILPFRAFGSTPPGKPRGSKKPARRPRDAGRNDATPGAEPGDVDARSDASRPVPVLTADLTLSEVLKKSGSGPIARIHEHLGLLGTGRPHVLRAAVTKTLLQRTFLNSLTKRLPRDSNKLLRTVVRSGGYVPASVLFQNTGPDAPPPDYVQPLLQAGLLYFGRQAARGAKARQGLVAVIPTDLLDRLGTVLRIPID